MSVKGVRKDLNNMITIQDASTWLSNPILRNLRGSYCSLRVILRKEYIETRPSAFCSIFLKRFGLVNRIPYDTIVSVDLKEEGFVELIFNEHRYLERKLNIYTNAAGRLAEAIGSEIY